jgi:hypothetical protein
LPKYRNISMPQLTGLQTGSAQSDLFVGNLEIVDLTAIANNAGILNANINSLGGNDILEGSAALVPTVAGVALTATGISQSLIDAGSGDDTVLAAGVGSGLFEGFTLRGPRYSGTGSGYGLSRGSVNGGAGSDTLSFSGTGKSAKALVGVGISVARVEGGAGADNIAIAALASGSSDNGLSGTATGVANSTVSGGGQQDVIGITATAELNGYSGSFPAWVKGVEQSFIYGDGEDDSIAITATGRGGGSTVSAAVQSQLRGGSGHDTISLTSKSDQSFTRAVSLSDISTSIGAEDNSWVQGGAGNDVITLTAEASGANATAYAASGAQVQGAEGFDKITLSAKGDSFGQSAVFGALNTEVEGGSEDDVIELVASTNSRSAMAKPSKGIAAAAKQSSIKGGSGDDTILFKLSGFAQSGSSAGIMSSQVYGNGGRDVIKVEAASFANFDVVDSLIFGGDGDDTFEVGIGSGTLQGDAGNDQAILNYFNAETMDVVAVAGGIQISGSQTKSGTAGEWRQTILSTEQFQIGETLYTATDLVAAFTV